MGIEQLNSKSLNILWLLTEAHKINNKYSKYNINAGEKG